jgi:hypothetical protein
MTKTLTRTHRVLDEADAKLTLWDDAVTRLMEMGATSNRNRSGENRMDRAEDMTVSEVSETSSYGYVVDTVTAKVKGTTATYDVRITVAPARGYNCSCQDTANEKNPNRRSNGPCKHTLALAEQLQENELLVEARNIQDERDSDCPDHMRGVTPGTFAFTARMMAGPNPSREAGEFWDRWKNQQKEGMW